MSDTARIDRSLTDVSGGRGTGMTVSNECWMLACAVCTDPGCDHGCHLSRLSPAPAPAPASPPVPAPGVEAGAGGGASDVGQGSGGPGAPLFPRPTWWGESGCRHAGDDGHVCLDVFGGPPAETRRPCVAEARAAMADLFDRYREVAS